MVSAQKEMPKTLLQKMLMQRQMFICTQTTRFQFLQSQEHFLNSGGKNVEDMKAKLVIRECQILLHIKEMYMASLIHQIHGLCITIRVSIQRIR